LLAWAPVKGTSAGGNQRGQYNRRKQNPSQPSQKRINCKIPCSYANFWIEPRQKMRKYFDKIQQILPQLSLPISADGGFQKMGGMFVGDKRGRKGKFVTGKIQTSCQMEPFSKATVMGRWPLA
jgi:hypothetical protein